MSFAIYTSRPALFAASVGGVTLGVALLLLPWKDISFGKGRSTHPLLATKRASFSPSKTTIKRENNCKAISGLEKVIMPLSNNPEDYIQISCQNSGKEDDEVLDNTWVALFHKNIFNGKVDEMVAGYTFGIRTLTEIKYSEKEDTKLLLNTVFQSERFSHGDIKGKWEYGDLRIDEKIVDVVYLDAPYSSERIYFVHGHQEQKET